MLSLDSMWRSFMDYVHQNGGWTGVKKDWGPHAPHTMNLRDFVQARRQDGLRAAAEAHEDQLNAVNAEELAAIEEMRGEEYVWREHE